ncbi:MAG: DUF2203 domain-containing protein [Cyanobacteria bacterium P01_E01_bin.6]
MAYPPSSEDSRSSDAPDDQDFIDALNDAQVSLDQLKERYAQVTAAQEQRNELRAQYSRTQSELRRHRTKELKKELNQIKEKLSELDIVFESRLVDPFWMAIRFGGLGIVIGWAISAIAN